MAIAHLLNLTLAQGQLSAVLALSGEFVQRENAGNPILNSFAGVFTEGVFEWLFKFSLIV